MDWLQDEGINYTNFYISNYFSLQIRSKVVFTCLRLYNYYCQWNVVLFVCLCICLMLVNWLFIPLYYRKKQYCHLKLRFTTHFGITSIVWVGKSKWPHLDMMKSMRINNNECDENGRKKTYKKDCLCVSMINSHSFLWVMTFPPVTGGYIIVHRSLSFVIWKNLKVEPLFSVCVRLQVNFLRKQ